MNTIQLLESLPGMFDEDKASILLVHGNLKPSAFVITEGEIFHLDEEPLHVEPQRIETLEKILKDFNLAYSLETVVMENSSNREYEHGQEVLRIFVAHDQDTAEKLRTAFGDIQNNHIAAGYLLGYPATAVEAFLTPNMLSFDNQPTSTDVVSEVNMRLLGHRLSKDNWEEEVKYLQPAGEYIKSVSPKIYETITEEVY